MSRRCRGGFVNVAWAVASFRFRTRQSLDWSRPRMAKRAASDTAASAEWAFIASVSATAAPAREESPAAEPDGDERKARREAAAAAAPRSSQARLRAAGPGQPLPPLLAPPAQGRAISESRSTMPCKAASGRSEGCCRRRWIASRAACAVVERGGRGALERNGSRNVWG